MWSNQRRLWHRGFCPLTRATNPTARPPATVRDPEWRGPARRPIVLILLPTYWPGHEATGPNQSIASLCDALADRYDFRIVGRRRSGPKPVATPVATDEWIDQGFAKARYLPDSRAWAAGLSRLLTTTPYDIILAGSFFDAFLVLPTLVLRRLGRLPARPIIVSPRGELSPGALGLKPYRKKIFIALAHPTSDLEDQELSRAFPWLRRTAIAPNIRHLVPLPEGPAESAPGAPLRVVFLSRIDRKKNLDFALRALQSVRATVCFDIYGPVSDPDFMGECEALMRKLPSHIEAHYCGAAPNDAVVSILARYDLFFLPTLSENYGHAIVDALIAGVPILISDQTPWTGLEAARAGWSLPLDDPGAFTRVIDEFAALPSPERKTWRAGARDYIDDRLNQNEAGERTRGMFETALAAGRQHDETALPDVERYFDRMASNWSDRYDPDGPFRRRIASFASTLRSRTSGSARVLDLGCGTGVITRALAGEGWKLTGCDISAAMLDVARNTGGDIEFLQIDRLGDTPTPFADQSFDAIVASSVLEYVPDPQKALDECARLLTPGGYFVATVPDPRHWLRRLEAQAQTWPWRPNVLPWTRLDNWRDYLRLSISRPDLETWRTWAGQAGFELETWSPRASALAMMVGKKL